MTEILRALFIVCKIVSPSGVGPSVMQSLGLSSLFHLRTVGSRLRYKERKKMKLSLLPSPNVFFFALAGSLSIHYLYFHILLFLSLWLVLSFFSFFCSCFFFFWNTYSHTFLAVWILFYELKSLRNVYFAILRCAHFATPYLNSLLLQIFFFYFDSLWLYVFQKHTIYFFCNVITRPWI